MSNEAQITLVRAAMDLRASAPSAWPLFIKAVELHADALKDACISSSLDFLPVAQGRAQAMRDLARSLREAPTVAERLHNQEKSKR